MSVIQSFFSFGSTPKKKKPKKPVSTESYSEYENYSYSFEHDSSSLSKVSSIIYDSDSEDSHLSEGQVADAGATVDEQNIGRQIIINDHLANKHHKYPNNYVTTARYTWWNFPVLVLWFQFHRLANCYFLLISMLQVFTDLSPTGKYTTLGPLLAVLSITAAKEGYEDYQRHKQDKFVNNREVTVVRGGREEVVKWQDVEVGDVCLVRNKEPLPCDLILLASSEDQSMCYIETSNLDGETNLKIRQARPETTHINSTHAAGQWTGSLDCEQPNERLYKFDGLFTFGKKKIPLSNKQMLLRGSTVRNTQWVYGIAVFTGPETKLFKNANDPPSKRTNVEAVTNRQILYIVCLQMVLCLTSAVARTVWATKVEKNSWYVVEDSDFNAAKDGALSLITFLILYNNLIPISLYVSIEMVKLVQAFWINSDEEMKYEVNDPPTYAQARTSNLNEELGQVEYIFSDKTGTLTRNMMEFRKCSIAGIAYGETEDLPEDKRTKDMDKSFNFNDHGRLRKNLKNHKSSATIREFLVLLAVCHTVIPEEDMKTGEIEFQASSPDEAALVSAAKALGYKFWKKTPDALTIEIDGKDFEYKILNILEFNSTRKRMSVICLTPEGELKLYCKGADTVIYERLASSKNPFKSVTEDHLREFAAEGLRTLCLACTDLDPVEYKKWNKKFKKASTSIVDRDGKLAECAEQMEKNLRLLGATAIEDKLQVGVPEAIYTLSRAGIKIWVLTGDKQETAINIGFSCRLLTQRMKLMIINEDTKEGTRRELQKYLKETEGNDDPDSLALIIDGVTLLSALQEDLQSMLVDLGTRCKAVICCRVSPKQKAEVVGLAKGHLNAITLAIGDGANDVSMIQAAHVGIGISGEEGLQAARAADYSIAQFRYLVRLLLIHGRWSYRRISTLICYSFYKNIALYLTQFWFTFRNGFSGTSLYEGWTQASFNLIFAFLPIIAQATLDQDVSQEKSLEYPQLYMLGIHKKFYNFRVFWGWVVSAIFHSVVLFWIPVTIFQHEIPSSDGTNGGMYFIGSVVYACVVVAVNLKVGLETHYWTWLNHLTIWGSIASIFVYYAVYCALWNTPANMAPQMYFVFYRLAPLPLFWFTVIMVPIATLLRDFVWKSVKRAFWPEMYHIVQEIAMMERDGTLVPGQTALDLEAAFNGGGEILYSSKSPPLIQDEYEMKETKRSRKYQVSESEEYSEYEYSE
eukprot:TRINITY_DN2587_c0_g2_i3.p1 TRINITY_DN2587_c0_g2~~TRINITY_DN2587_c0_g2_i3.p1  ORF type:complete len:1203 (+),score=339.25 TRINITY_DN2587_c0_g2_i3:849-4457(+)